MKCLFAYTWAFQSFIKEKFKQKFDVFLKDISLKKLKKVNFLPEKGQIFNYYLK